MAEGLFFTGSCRLNERVGSIRLPGRVGGSDVLIDEEVIDWNPTTREHKPFQGVVNIDGTYTLDKLLLLRGNIGNHTCGCSGSSGGLLIGS